MSKPTYGFFSSLTHSVYSPAFYAGLSRKTTMASVWYLLRVTLILFLLGALIILIPIVKNWDTIDQSIQNALNVYPEDLVLTFQDGQMTSNQVEPYFIESKEIVPEQWREDFMESTSGEFPKNIVVIDTVTPYTQEQFAAYDVLVWLSKDTVYIEDEAITSDRFQTSPTPLWIKLSSIKKLPLVGSNENRHSVFSGAFHCGGGSSHHPFPHDLLSDSCGGRTHYREHHEVKPRLRGQL